MLFVEFLLGELWLLVLVEGVSFSSLFSSHLAFRVISLVTGVVKSYSWPGNIRELKSVVESYLILIENKKIDEQIFFDVFFERSEEPMTLKQSTPMHKKENNSLKNMSKDIKEKTINDALIKYSGDKKQVAEALGISYTTVWRFAKK